MTNLSLEEFENGIKLYQDEKLYKFTSDAIKLAKFCRIKSSDKVLDMCAGCGVVGLYAYSINKCDKIYFNDIQPQMCKLLDKNIKLNNLQDSAKVICKDLAELSIDDFEKALDVIMCNPPYFKLNGKITPREDIAICKHEIATNLQTIISKAGKLIKPKGRFYLVIPSERLCECVILLNKAGFEVKQIQLDNHKGESKICLLKNIKNAKSGVKITINT